MFFSNLTFDFDLILGSIFTFRGPIGLFLDLVSRDVPTGYFVFSGGYPNVFCALLVHHSLPCRLFSRDVTAWLFRLYWILFPEMSQLVISSLLEDIQMYFVLSSCTTVSLVDSSPEMLPPGYFVSTGSWYQRCPNWLFRLFWRISKCILCSPRAPLSH